MSSLPSPEVRALRRELLELRSRLDRIESGSRTSQLGRSSVDGGFITFTDGAGTVVGRAGRQPDGKFGWGDFNGEPPPRPNTPELVATTAGLAFIWNGEFDAPRGSDFRHVVAHLSPSGPSFVASDDNAVGRLIGAGTLPVTAINDAPLSPGQNYWGRLIGYNASGVASEESITVGPVQIGAVVADEVLDGIVDTLALADDAVTAAKIAVGQINTGHVTFTARDIGGVTTYFQAGEPTAGVEGDLWADSDDGNTLYRFDGADWVLAQDEGIAQAILDAAQASSDAADAVAAAATKITTFYAASPPTATATGDLWIETDQGNRLHRWDGDSWELVQDTSIAAAIDLANDAQATADGKVVTFAQTSAPTAEGVGDLWIDTDDDNKLYRWDGDSWNLVRDDGIGQAIADAAAAQAAADAAAADAAQAISDAAGAQATADGKVQVFYQASAPGSGSGRQTGDLWIDTDDNSLWRWSGSAWVSVQDEDIAAAIAAAGTAQATADGKITAFYQTSAPGSGMDTGDLWYDTDNGNKPHRWDGDSWEALQAGTDAIADDAITGSKIVAETIQGIHIAAEQIFGNHIAAEQITGGHIEALAIVAGHIAANAIESGHITAGAITADKLESLLVMASQIIAGDPDDWHLQLGDSNTPILFWNGETTGFAVSRDVVTGQANVYLSGRVEFGNGSQIENDYLDLAELPSTGFQEPKVRQQRAWIASGPATAVTAQWQAATQKGSLCLMAVWQTGTAGSTPNCGTPSGATIIDSRVSGLDRLTLFYVPNSPTSRTSEPFTSAFAAKWAIALIEYTGVAASPLDVQAFATGTGTTASSGTTSTTTQANELQVFVTGAGSIGWTNGANNQWTAPTNGFTKILESDGVGNQGIAVATKNATATGAVSTALTANKSVPWIGLVATFKAAAAAGTPPQPRAGTYRTFARSLASKATPYVIDDTGVIYPIGRRPYCRVRLTAPSVPAGGTDNGFFISAAGGDVWAQGDWSVPTGGDPYSMVSISTGVFTYSNITIPVAGIWHVNFKTVAMPSALTEHIIACFVAKNARTANDSVARSSEQLHRYGTGDVTPIKASEYVTLAAGDVLYWGNWASTDAYIFNGRVNTFTEVSVYYWGPG